MRDRLITTHAYLIARVRSEHDALLIIAATETRFVETAAVSDETVDRVAGLGDLCQSVSGVGHKLASCLPSSACFFDIDA